MPAIVTCKKLGRCELHWNVGSDDFVVPGVIAIVVGFFNLTLVIASLFVLYYVPFTVLSSHEEPCNVTYSPLLYAPLFSLAAVETCFILTEGIIVIVSAQGPINKKESKSFKFRTKVMPHLISLRIVVAVLELLAIIASLVGVFHPSAISDIKQCEPLLKRLYFAQAIVLFQVLYFIAFLLKVCVYTDPLGCSTPVGSSVGNNSKYVYERKLRTLFTCLGVKKEKPRGVALADVAYGLYSIFSNTRGIVLSDVIAGLSLLRQNQLSKKMHKSEAELTKKFKMACIEIMPPEQRSEVESPVDHPFDFTNEHNQLLFEDLEHYMHYAMGVYGWPLHVFDNLGCGVCQLCKVTCCRFRCLHGRAGRDFIQDNCCMCGVGTFKLRTNIPESDILYANFENKIGFPPFIVCWDHDMKALVICVRGTLSLKDTLTDMNYSPAKVSVDRVKVTYVHGGMFKAATDILDKIKHILSREFTKHSEYRLVLTGHSLGAGVASILALLIKQEMKYSDEVMKCYAFSPPGALFSFPLAEYSKSFITSVVLGNDIVPRLTLRSLLHLKYSVKHLLDNSEVPKYQILYKSKTCAALCKCCSAPEDRVGADEDGDSLEWKVFNFDDGTKITTALMHDLLFGRPGITQPVECPLPSFEVATPHTQTPNTATRGTGDRVQADSEGVAETPSSCTALTPDGPVARAMLDIKKTCSVDGSNSFVPFFLPGRLLHLQVQKSNRWCGEHQYTVMEVDRENMCVLFLDRGVLDDHLPNNVLNALKLVKKKKKNMRKRQRSEAHTPMQEESDPMATQTTVTRSKKVTECSENGFNDSDFVTSSYSMADLNTVPELGDIHDGGTGSRIGLRLDLNSCGGTESENQVTCCYHGDGSETLSDSSKIARL